MKWVKKCERLFYVPMRKPKRLFNPAGPVTGGWIFISWHDNNWGSGG
jgi:hypothetical protein